VTTRASTSDPWTEAVNLGPTVNSSAWDGGPSISADGLSLFFFSGRPGGSGGFDLWVTTRTTVSEPWGTPVNLGPTVNSSAEDATPDISADGLALFFFSTRSGGYGNYDLWVTTRTTKDGNWGTPVNLGAKINSSAYDFSPNISADGSTLFFTSGRSGGLGGDDIWQVPIAPGVDFNCDGKVDVKDFSRLAQFWFDNESSVDIAPETVSERIVNCKDLSVLAECWLTDFRLIAHWKLDETEGTIAYDSVGENDGKLHGEPVWQRPGGQIDGALQFDGIDDYVSAGFVLTPVDLSLSVFAWVKGGAPGEVIISQKDGIMPGAIWLGTDASEGTLMTTLMVPFFPPLESDSVITDGQWHHVGLVYDFDSFQRRLYVDGAEVAEDTTVVAGLRPDGDLYFGAGKDLDAGSFFFGLIDDVRIYPLVLSAEEIEELAR
jgi:hypothetical protein